MTTLRLLFTRRWMGYLAFTVIFSVVCVALGQWQFARRAEAQTAIARLNANFDQSPALLDELVPQADSFDAELKWRPVVVTGEYLADEVLYARNRPKNGTVGFDVVVPFRTSDGRVIVIDRGWIEGNDDNSMPADPPPVPRGQIEVVARLYPSEIVIAGRSAPAGQLATIHVPAIAEVTGPTTVTGWYAQLATETPASEAGQAFTKPVLDEGPHLSYALQWYVFALMAFIALGWALNKEARAEAPARLERRSRRDVPRARRDEDIEDAAWDDATRAR